MFGTLGTHNLTGNSLFSWLCGSSHLLPRSHLFPPVPFPHRSIYVYRVDAPDASAVVDAAGASLLPYGEQGGDDGGGSHVHDKLTTKAAEELGRQRRGVVCHQKDEGRHQGSPDEARHLPRLR